MKHPSGTHCLNTMRKEYLLYYFDGFKQSRQHPEWQTKDSFKSVLRKALLAIIHESSSAMTTEPYSAAVASRLKTARHHSRFKRSYHELVYQPMLALLNYLYANGFKTYIVSAGEVEFMRV